LTAGARLGIFERQQTYPGPQGQGLHWQTLPVSLRRPWQD
jgi:hypothetical protein